MFITFESSRHILQVLPGEKRDQTTFFGARVSKVGNWWEQRTKFQQQECGLKHFMSYDRTKHIQNGIFSLLAENFIVTGWKHTPYVEAAVANL